MRVKMFTFNLFQTNCYVLSCEEAEEAIVIDPALDSSSEAEEIREFVKSKDLQLKSIVNTHGHPDHTCGNGLMKKLANVPILIHADDAYMLGPSGKRTAEYFGFKYSSPPADGFLKDGDSVKFGSQSLLVIHSPGHSPGSICLLGRNLIFTGDTLFAGSIGRTDFPESSHAAMKTSLEKLKTLHDDLAVYPGHGPATTIGFEKLNNPFLTGLL